jgi:hypothetical protein
MGTEALWIAAVALALGLGAAAVAWNKVYVTAAPDEWLLQIRDGRLVAAGVGIALWRLPGDVVARFTSTMQRVGFTAEALTAEALKVSMEGFILWAVDPRDDRPFLAFRSLGLANLLAPPSDLKHPKHLLTGPQHKALQQLVGSTAQRHVSTLALGEILGDQDGFVAGLAARLRAVLEPMGAELRQVEVLAARPADAALLRDLATREEERIREEAALVRLEAAERLKRRELAAQRSARLDQLEGEAAAKRREQELARENAEQAERHALEALEARLQREAEELRFAAEKRRRLAEAERDAELAGIEAEERKPQAVRDHELGRLALESASRMLSVTDARWVTVGDGSPVAGLAAVLAGLRELAAGKAGA